MIFYVGEYWLDIIKYKNKIFCFWGDNFSDVCIGEELNIVDIIIWSEFGNELNLLVFFNSFISDILIWILVNIIIKYVGYIWLWEWVRVYRMFIFD